MKAWKIALVIFSATLLFGLFGYNFYLRNTTGPQIIDENIPETKVKADGLDYFAEYGNTCELPVCEEELQKEDGE